MNEWKKEDNAITGERERKIRRKEKRGKNVTKGIGIKVLRYSKGWKEEKKESERWEKEDDETERNKKGKTDIDFFIHVHDIAYIQSRVLNRRYLKIYLWNATFISQK